MYVVEPCHKRRFMKDICSCTVFCTAINAVRMLRSYKRTASHAGSAQTECTCTTESTANVSKSFGWSFPNAYILDIFT